MSKIRHPSASVPPKEAEIIFLGFYRFDEYKSVQFIEFPKTTKFFKETFNLSKLSKEIFYKFSPKYEVLWFLKIEDFFVKSVKNPIL